MNLTYNLDFDVAALFLIVAEIVYLRLEYSNDKYSNRLFIMLLHTTFLFTIVDLASSLVLTTYSKVTPSEVVRIIMALYFLSNAFLYLVFYRYVVEYLDDKQEKTVAYYVKTYFPFVFIIECLIANGFANIFYAGGKYGHFSYGTLITIIYFYPLYYFLLTIISLVKNRKRISIKQHFSVVSSIAIAIIAILVQFTHTEIQTLAFGYSFSLLLMLFSLETPDYKSLMEKTEQLENIREEIEHQDAFNRAFIMNVSSDISGSIGNMLAKNDTIPTNTMNNAQKEVHQYVEGYGRLVRSIINNTIVFSKVSTNNLIQDVKEYSIYGLVSQVKDVMTPALVDRSNTIIVNISNTPPMLVGAEAVVKQIMINMVYDANKYTKKGTITLSINSRRTSRNHVNLLITVEDTGVGMERSMVKKLIDFNPKKRSWNRTVFEDGNFNVYITKNLIEDLNGKLHIDSAPGQGSVFSAIIPQETIQTE